MGDQLPVPEGDGGGLAGVVVGSRSDPAEAEDYAAGLGGEEFQGLDDEGRVVLDDEAAREFVAPVEEFPAQEVEVPVVPTAVEDLGADDEGEESGVFVHFSFSRV